jgi:L-threonylcarbamoyladenylate synthase
MAKVLSADEVECAAHLMKQGKLVAFPTETVYGLGAPIFHPEAVASIFKVKGRPADNPLIAHIACVEQVECIAVDIPDPFYVLANAFFPGPLTVVLKRHAKVPAIVSAGLDSIALRMPSHPIALKLIALVGEPLVAPSANLSGKPSATQAGHVLEDFDGQIAAVIDGGKTQFGIESTVISLLDKTPVLLRPGSIAKEQIEEVLKTHVSTQPVGPIRSPGMKYRHYAPKAPIRLFDTFDALKKYILAQPAQRMVLSMRPLPEKWDNSYVLSACEFYSLLRFSDQEQMQEIVVLCDEELRSQTALMNRLLHSSMPE